MQHQALCDLLAATISDLHDAAKHPGFIEECPSLRCRQVLGRITLVRDALGEVHAVQQVDGLLD